MLEQPPARRLLWALASAWLSYGMVALAVFLAVRGAGGSECAGGAGASAPPLVASIRGRWAHVVEQPLLRRAFALMSLLGDIGMVAAAVVAAAVAARDAPPAGRPYGTYKGRSPLASTTMRVLLVVSVALGAALGLVEVGVLAAATRWDVTAYAGFSLGAFALGSVAGGLWSGRQRWQRPPEQRYLLWVLLLAVAVAPPMVASNATVLALLLLLAGVGYGPATISLFEALDVLAPDSGTEALTWVTTAEALGTATGAAAAGAGSVWLGAWAPFAIACTAAGTWPRSLVGTAP